MKKLLDNAVTGVMVLCALTVTALAVRHEFFDPAGRPPAAAGPRVVKNWRDLARVGQRMGAPDAKVTIVEFSDFECPFCARLEQRLHALLARDPSAFTVVYRHYPLAQHTHARDAALAAECAGAQGRFAAFHDALFANQDSIGTASWGWFARSAGGVDSTALRRCMAGPDVARRLAEDKRAGDRLGVAGTPTFLVNGRLFSGAPSEEELSRMIRDPGR
jgi:protein-disulfide isomerase